jgi:cyclophilin family peptidyl-prolyl cis-trans isomerase
MMRTTRFALAACAAALLAACGGGSSGGEDRPSINGIAVAPASYGRTAVWTVSGLHLDRGVQLAITSGRCDDVAELPGGSDTQRQFTCRPAALGELIGQVNELGGGRLASLRVVVPQPAVQLTLAQGTIELELDPERAPVTVNNFLDYVNSGFYNNTIFHRVVADFVIQGGGYVPGNPDPVFKTPGRPPIALESDNGLSNARGTLAMARTSAPDSATSQFYVNVVDNPDLDYRSEAEPGYAVFGKVVAGMDVVDAISVVSVRAVPSLGLTHVPVTNVVVTAARQVR